MRPRVAIIDHGQIVACGSPSELKRDVAGESVLLSLPEETSTQVEQLEQLVDAPRHCGRGGPPTPP